MRTKIEIRPRTKEAPPSASIRFYPQTREEIADMIWIETLLKLAGFGPGSGPNGQCLNYEIVFVGKDGNTDDIQGEP